MKIKKFALALEAEDFDLESPNLISDFNLQVNYLTEYIRKRLRKERFDADNFSLILFRGRKQPSDIMILKEHFKSLCIEVIFDEKRYKKIYPQENDYPIEDLLKPIIHLSDFNDPVIKMIIEGLEKGRTLAAPIPYGFILNTVLDFKNEGCKNEWIHKTKLFKEYGVRATLFCKLNPNLFH
ncbi:hypothetical protein HP439_09415 [Sphingobacterium shayense]|uniref:hypothetical protein n=1 Tax=Sphingobacterium shayense TaxID=626343 RepID=UPI001556A179|nr:hypothetical protein [Sphingobacterium shayense]NQD70934.1 hypothetical protein [Sphingobacterium shayense]